MLGGAGRAEPGRKAVCPRRWEGYCVQEPQFPGLQHQLPGQIFPQLEISNRTTKHPQDVPCALCVSPCDQGSLRMGHRPFSIGVLGTIPGEIIDSVVLFVKG